jgi:hypothetical protein
MCVQPPGIGPRAVPTGDHHENQHQILSLNVISGACSLFTERSEQPTVFSSTFCL